MTPSLRPMAPMTRVERFGLALGLVLCAALMWPIRGHVTDETFMHLQYARHLAEGRGPVFNSGEHVYGCTSPLWAALIGDAMAAGFDGLKSARLLGALATLVTIPLFLQLMRRTVRLASLRACATLAWATHPWMLKWSTSGLETPLAVALMLAGFVAFTEGRSWGSRPVRTGTLWALAALTRPQLVFLLVLWGLVLLVDTNNRAGLRRFLYGLLPPAIIYGSWLLFARVYFGTFWPRSLSMYSPVVGHRGFDLGLLGGQLALLLRSDALLVVVLAMALIFGGRAVWGRIPSAIHLLPWLWVISIPVLFATRGIPPTSRYLLVVLPVLAWLAWQAADRWWLGGDPQERPRRVQTMVFAFVTASLLVVQNLRVYRSDVVPEVSRSTRAMTAGLMRWGRWLREHAPQQATIASPQVGALGYFSNHRVIDLSGLISPPLESRTRVDPRAVGRFAFADVVRPTFLAHRADRPFALLRESEYGAALIPIDQAPAYTRGAATDSVYTLYRIDWSAFDSLRARR